MPGGYRMVTRIGRGGMGDVWRADDMVLNTPVALKLIAAKGPVGRDRFLNEVRLARQITHPAVCRVFDVGESGEWIFYSMEFVSGEDLASLIRRVGRLPSDRVTDIARQLCGGLAAAHAQGVLHRDLKPANILVDDAGLVRITDFGIAILRTDAGLHMLTGTPGYMAPEQRTTGTTLSERTDVYALGLVLYELLVGQHPLGERPRQVVTASAAVLDRADRASSARANHHAIARAQARGSARERDRCCRGAAQDRYASHCRARRPRRACRAARKAGGWPALARQRSSPSSPRSRRSS